MAKSMDNAKQSPDNLKKEGAAVSAKLIKTANPSQQLLKRQREWVYLAHFLALMRLHPIKTISGQDDGQEPDFTCLFRHQTRATPYVIGIELTTLPRLRDRLGNDNLMLKRWYWQSRLQVSTGFNPSVFDSKGRVINGSLPYMTKNNTRVRPVSLGASDHITPPQALPTRGLSLGNRVQRGLIKTMGWLPSAFLEDLSEDGALPIESLISQADIDAVMQKKAHKIQAYQKKRQLDEVWLLIHTNEAQENGLLSFDPAVQLTHHSDFNQVFVTLYPNNGLLQLAK